MAALVNYCIEKYSIYPIFDEIVSICNSTISLFPSLSTHPSECGGIVSRKNYWFGFLALTSSIRCRTCSMIRWKRMDFSSILLAIADATVHSQIHQRTLKTSSRLQKRKSKWQFLSGRVYYHGIRMSWKRNCWRRETFERTWFTPNLQNTKPFGISISLSLLWYAAHTSHFHVTLLKLWSF